MCKDLRQYEKVRTKDHSFVACFDFCSKDCVFDMHILLLMLFRCQRHLCFNRLRDDALRREKAPEAFLYILLCACNNFVAPAYQAHISPLRLASSIFNYITECIAGRFLGTSAGALPSTLSGTYTGSHIQSSSCIVPPLRKWRSFQEHSESPYEQQGVFIRKLLVWGVQGNIHFKEYWFFTLC